MSVSGLRELLETNYRRNSVDHMLSWKSLSIFLLGHLLVEAASMTILRISLMAVICDNSHEQNDIASYMVKDIDQLDNEPIENSSDIIEEQFTYRMDEYTYAI